MSRGQNIDTVYLDFAEGFDKVDHGGITGKLGLWLHDFLSDMKQKVQ